MIPVAAMATAGSNTQLHARASSAIKITTLTTPFVPPTSCQDAFLPTTTITTTLLNGDPYRTTTIWELQVASTAGCQPPEMEDGSYVWTTLSPAVCPSGWTAYSLSASTTYKMKMADVQFYAWCCTR